MRGVLEGIKVWWMIYWRLTAIDLLFIESTSAMNTLVALAILAISIVIPIVLVGIRGKTLRTWPILRAIRGKHPVTYWRTTGQQNSYPPYSSPTSVISSPAAPPAAVNSGYVSRGGDSRYAPRHLETVSLPMSSLSYGEPGKNIAGAQGLSSYNTSAGALGERNFAKVLGLENLIFRVTSLWSVQMPSEHTLTPDPTLKTDIDCILIYDNTLLLLDMKLYAGGEITYRSRGDQLYKFDTKTGVSVGKPVRMTKNMEIATERFKKHFPSLSVYSMVVFMPSDRGAATIEGVVWPGGIPAVNLEDLLEFLNRSAPGMQVSRSPHAARIIPLVS